jgi:hypothetical protein
VNVDKSGLDKIWDGILDEGPKPDAGIEAVKTAVMEHLVEFDQRIGRLLDRLRAVSANPSFDQEKARRRLIRLAQAYFLRQVTTPATDRVAGLNRLAEALGRVRDLAETTRQDHVGSDLFSLWFDRPPRDPGGQIVRNDDGSLRTVYFPEFDLKEMVASLAAFQAASIRAAKNVPTTAPGPAAILPQRYIGALADAYLELTGRKPGAGLGPFYRFVVQFRAALDPSYETTDESGDERLDESMIEAIKKALHRWRRAQGNTK